MKIINYLTRQYHSLIQMLNDEEYTLLKLNGTVVGAAFGSTLIMLYILYLVMKP